MLTPSETVASAPLNTIARPHWLIALLSTTNELIVVPDVAGSSATVIAVGADVTVAPPLPPA